MLEIIPLGAHEAAIKGANLLVKIDYAAFDASVAAQTIALFNVKAKDTVQLMRAELVKVYDSASDAAVITTTVTVGDGDAAAGFLASMELNPSGTEIFAQGGVKTNATAKTYTADDTVDSFWATTALKAMNLHSQGELHLWFNFIPYARD